MNNGSPLNRFLIAAAWVVVVVLAVHKDSIILAAVAGANVGLWLMDALWTGWWSGFKAERRDAQ